MGDLECGFEEMQGVRLGYLLIKGKQMFALSQVFTDLLKNIPRTTVHKRMDHLKVKKHQCDLEELRKLKAINSIAFHAAKCTLISREDVEALYFSCKTERVLKSTKRRAKETRSPGNRSSSPGLLHAAEDAAELWKEKVWLSLHGVPQALALRGKTGRRRELAPCLGDSDLPQFYQRTHSREHRSSSKSTRRHYKNYETDGRIAGGSRVASSQRHAFFRGAGSRQPALLQSAMAAAQSRLARSAGDLLHKRKRRREGGARHSLSRSRHAHHHIAPVLFVQPKSTQAGHGTSFGPFHLEPDFFVGARPRHYHHHHAHHQPVPNLHEGYSSDTESSTYSEQAYPDSDFGSGFSTSSNSGSSEEEEDEDDEEEDDDGEEEDYTHSESSEVSSDEEESSSQSDSSSVSSRVSLQSIRFRRARVGSVLKSLHGVKAPLLLQPTFRYNNQAQQERQRKRSLLPPAAGASTGHDALQTGDDSRQERRQKCEFICSERRKSPAHSSKFHAFAPGDSLFVGPKGENVFASDSNVVEHAGKQVPHYSPGPNWNAAFQQSRTKSCDRNGLPKEATPAHQKLPSPLKTIKTEVEEPCVTPATHSEGGRPAAKGPPFNLQTVKIKVEESYDDYEYQAQGTVVTCKGGKVESSSIAASTQADVFKATEQGPDLVPKSASGPQECSQDAGCIDEGGSSSSSSNRLPRSKKPRVSRARSKQNALRVNNKVASASTSSCSFSSSLSSSSSSTSSSSSSSTSSRLAGCEVSTEDIHSTRRKRSHGGTVASSPAKTRFSLMANFPSPPSLVVGSDGDLCPAYSLNSLRAPGPPPSSHPVWRWQQGGQILPPPQAHRTRKY